MPHPYSLDDEIKEYKPPLLKTDRSMWKLMILDILTLHLYSIFFFIPFSFDIDKVDPKRDGSRTLNYLFAYVLSLFTFAIVLHIWHYQMAERVEEALAKRDIAYDFGKEHFWLWYLLGSLFIVGPFIYFHKLCTAMNLLCEHYNADPNASYQ